MTKPKITAKRLNRQYILITTHAPGGFFVTNKFSNIQAQKVAKSMATMLNNIRRAIAAKVK